MVQTRGATAAVITKFEQDAKNLNLVKDDFDVFECIGQGGQGCVYRAKHKESGVDVALKRIPTRDQIPTEDGNGFVIESFIHRNLGHPNIVRLYGRTKFCGEEEDADDAVWIILEYCPEGTLKNVISKKTFSDMKSKESFLAEAVGGILHAMKYMQTKGILHRDIKPDNILYKDGTPKLADFGISAPLQWYPGSRASDVSGTFPLMAPEALSMVRKSDLRESNSNHEGFGYSYEADCWSLGVTIYSLLTDGLHPFRFQRKSTITETIQAYLKSSFSHRSIQFPHDVSDELKQFILALLHVKPEKRLSVDEALKHPWIIRHDHRHRVAINHLVSSHDKENNHAKRKPTKSKDNDRTSNDGVKDVEALLGGLNLNAM